MHLVESIQWYEMTTKGENSIPINLKAKHALCLYNLIKANVAMQCNAMHKYFYDISSKVNNLIFPQDYYLLDEE